MAVDKNESKTLRIYNVKILTMEPGECIFPGEVWITGDRISYVGEKRDLKGQTWDSEIDGEGNLLMPGFQNAHTHSAMTFLRSYADDLKLDEWLNTKIFPAEAKLTGEAVYWFTKLAIMEYLSGGITSAYYMYSYMEDGARAARDTGFRYVFCDSINNFTGSLQQTENYFRMFNQDESGRVGFRLGFHAEYTTDREIMMKIAGLSEKYQAPVSAHCSETVDEVESCIRRTGMTPVGYFDSLGLFRYGGTLFHCVHMTEGDYEIIKKRGIYVVTNPASNLKLASGIAPVSSFLEKEIPVAIGTDGPASNNCLDMFREMFLVTGLQKYLCRDPAAVPAYEVLKMATINGANAMGLTECGSIKNGKKADLILIDIHQPNMRPFRNPEKNLVYSGSKQNVKMTMVAGKVLYRDGEFYLDSSKEEIFKKAEEMAEKILGRS